MDWVFQNNPAKYDVFGKLTSANGETESTWAMNRYRGDVRPGDRVFFWQSGHDAAVIATGRVASTPYARPENRFGPIGVDVVYENLVSPPLTRGELATNPVLSSIEPFQGKFAQATNFRLSDAAAVEELERLVTARLKPLGPGIAPPPKLTMPQLLEAIDAARRDTAAELLQAITKMDPRDFEFLIKTLLDAQGYDEVEVTQFSGDRGIDLIATLSSGGISRIKTVVQAKRTPSVGLPIVQRLRGTLAKVNAGAGLLVTSGTFSPEARKDVVDVPLPPISLIGGQQLVQLLMKNNIGVRPSSLTLYSLALEDLTTQREQTENTEA